MKFEAKALKYGKNQLAFIIPKEVIDKEHIKENTEIKVIIDEL